jgi:hypothetical protein
MFISRVSGAIWTTDLMAGVWLLQSCPPGFELQNTAGSSSQFSQANQECSLCPARFYCIGGLTHRSACPPSTFSLPGSNVSTACTAAVFLEVAVLLPMRVSEFTAEKKALFAQALANACEISKDLVQVLRVDSSRRTAGNSIDVYSEIVAADRDEAEILSSRASTENLNQHLAAMGLPQGAVSSVILLFSDQNSSLPTGLIIGVIIAGAIFLGLIITIFYFLYRKAPESEEDKVFRLKISELRVLFHTSPSDGFFFNSERLPLGTRRESVNFLHKSWFEAAVRLGLLQDFEIRHFDSLSTSLEGHAAQNDALSTWVLEIATFLIRPSVVTNNSEESFGGGLSNLTLHERFDFFLTKVSKCQIWTNGGGALFGQLKSIAQELMKEVVMLCEIRTEELRMEPRGKELFSLKTYDVDGWQQCLQKEASLGTRYRRKHIYIGHMIVHNIC